MVEKASVRERGALIEAYLRCREVKVALARRLVLLVATYRYQDAGLRQHHRSGARCGSVGPGPSRS